MEDRPLLAVALVAGCVTAAGAGGYVAMRQASGPESPAPVVQVASAGADDVVPVESTEGEIVPLPESTEPEPVAPRSPATTPSPTGKSATPAMKAGPPRGAPAPAPTPPAAVAAPSRPAPVVVPRASSPRPPVAPPQAEPAWPDRPAPAPASRPGEPDKDAGKDPWPSRDGGDATRDLAWPATNSDSEADDGTRPGRSPAAGNTSAPAAVRRFESVTIPADSVIGVQLESSISSQTARVEDPVRARVTREVRSDGTVIIPAGAQLLGSVTLVEEGGKIRERARLGVRFHTLVLADGTELRLPTESIYRDGDSVGGRSAAKIGGAAAGGAILGAILGGGRGAIIGAATGAGSGTAVAMAGDRRPAELRAGQPITVRVTDAVTTQVER